MKTFVTFLLITISMFAQDGKYYRKSITSLGEIVFAQKPDQELKNMLYNRISQHIHLNRFDYNTLPKEFLEDFRAGLETMSDYDYNEIIVLFDRTVKDLLIKELENVKEIRANENLTEEQKVRAIVDKMKTSGITAEDILKVYNAAYLYLPVITSYSENEENGKYTFSISGFIVWLKVNTKDAKNFSIVPVNKVVVPFVGIEVTTVGEKYRIKNRELDYKQYAKLLACNTLVKNWAVDMKKIPEFSLAGEIANVDKGIFNNYLEVNIGTKEGVELDDGYDVVEVMEDEKGELQKKKIGFVRAEKIGDNKDKIGYNPTLFKPYISGNFERGQYLSERPNLGIDIGLRTKYFGLNISKDNFTFLNDDIKSAFGLDVMFSMNLAKLTGITQTFANIEASGGVFGADVDDSYEISNMYTYSLYFSLSKKFWLKRLNLELGAGYGYNVLSFKHNYKFIVDHETTYDLKAWGLKFDASFNYLVNPEFQIGVYAGYKLTTNIAEADIKDNEGNKSTYPILNSSTNFKGVAFGIHFTYTLPAFPVDPFSGISAMSIEY